MHFRIFLDKIYAFRDNSISIINHKDIVVSICYWHYPWLKLQEFVEKASIICCVNELNSLGGCDGDTPEKISAQLEEVKQTLRRESPRYGSIYWFTLSQRYIQTDASLSLSLCVYWVSLFRFPTSGTLNQLMTLGCCMRKKNVRLLKGSKFTKPFDRNWTYVFFYYIYSYH